MDAGAHVEEKFGQDAIPFSEALKKTGFGIFNYCLIFLGGVTIASVLFETASVGFILPIADCDLQMTNQDKGILGAIGYIGIIVSAHLWGFLSDTKGRRTVMMPTMLIGFLMTLVSSFSQQFWILVLTRFMNGFFISGSSAVIYAYVGEFHTDNNRSMALMAASCIFSIGAMLIPVTAWIVINHSWSIPISFLGIIYKPWRMFVVVCGLPGLVGGLALLFLPESPKFLLSVGKEKEAYEILKKMYRWNVGRGELQIKAIVPEKEIQGQHSKDFSLEDSNFVSKFLNTMWKQTAPVFQRGLLQTTVLICTTQFWMYVTIHGMFMWYPYITESMIEFVKFNPGKKSTICEMVYAQQAINQTNGDEGAKHCIEYLEDRTYLFSFGLELCFGVGFLVIGSIVRMVQKAHILFVCLVGFGACGIVAVFINDTTVAMILFNLYFLAALGIQVLSGTTVELYPTHLRGMALCISLMFGRLGGVAGSNVVGLLLSNNCELTFYIAATGLIVCGLSILCLPKAKHTMEDRSDVS